MAGGDGTIALVAGEPGIGKTRLVTEVASRASCEVHWSACWEGDGAPAFWPWVQLLRLRIVGDTATPVTSRDGTPVSAGRPAERAAATAARTVGRRRRSRRPLPPVRRRRRASSPRRASRRPLWLVIDDLQWADPGSVQLLRFLARDPRARRLVVVATYRDGAVATTAWLADDRRRGRRRRAPPPSRRPHRAEVEHLVERRAGRRRDAAPATERAAPPQRRQPVLRARVRATGRRAPVATAPAERRGGGVPATGPAVPRDPGELLTAAAVLGAEFDLATLVGSPESGMPDRPRRSR